MQNQYFLLQIYQNFYDFGDKILLPGFIDLHIHAPQWPQAGLALDDELSCWLDNFTFPLEAKYENVDYAKEVYTDLVKTLLANGTTSAMYFGTIHNEATLELAKICADQTAATAADMAEPLRQHHVQPVRLRISDRRNE